MPSTVAGKGPLAVGEAVCVSRGDSVSVASVDELRGVAVRPTVGLGGVLEQPINMTRASVATRFFNVRSVLLATAERLLIVKT